MSSKNKGFTLLELILVITIVTILSGVTFAKYRDILHKARLEKNVSQMVDQVSLARNRVLAKDLSPVASCATFEGYVIQVLTPSTYSIWIRCSGLDTLVNSYTLDKTLFIGTVPSIYLFKPPLAQLDSQQTITVKEPSSNKCTTIIIKPIGTISTTPPGTCI